MAGVLRQGFFGPGEARATSISRSGSVRSEQRSLERKGLPPFGLRPVWPVASLLVGHSPTAGMLPPRASPQAKLAEQSTSHLGDTTLTPEVGRSENKMRARYFATTRCGKPGAHRISGTETAEDVVPICLS